MKRVGGAISETGGEGGHFSVTFADVVVQPPINSDWAGSAPVGHTIHNGIFCGSCFSIVCRGSGVEHAFQSEFDLHGH